jgi:hypothetical protein
MPLYKHVFQSILIIERFEHFISYINNHASKKKRIISPDAVSYMRVNSVGYSTRKMHNIHREIPLSTIKYTIKMESRRINNHSLPRSG